MFTSYKKTACENLFKQHLYAKAPRLRYTRQPAKKVRSIKAHEKGFHAPGSVGWSARGKRLCKMQERGPHNGEKNLVRPESGGDQ